MLTCFTLKPSTGAVRSGSASDPNSSTGAVRSARSSLMSSYVSFQSPALAGAAVAAMPFAAAVEADLARFFTVLGGPTRCLLIGVRRQALVARASRADMTGPAAPPAPRVVRCSTS